MKATWWIAMLAIVTVSGVQAQSWQRDGKDFVLKADGGEIRYQAPGTLRIGSGTQAISLAIFLWHDAWVYEQLNGGTITSGPALDSRDWIRQTGTWVTRNNAAPMKYTLSVEPKAAGAVIHLETEKTAPLKLTSGIWCVLSMNRAGFVNGQRIYAQPGVVGKVGNGISGSGEALSIEFSHGKAVSFVPEGVREFRSHVSAQSHSIELNLKPGDFDVGEKATTSLAIRFTAMPDTLPGEITPSREPLHIGEVTPSPSSPRRFERLQLNVDLHGTWDNPFDPDDVALDAHVTEASGKTYTMPGFFMVDEKRQVSDGAEVMIPEGNGHWCVRLAPTAPGPLRIELVAKDRSGTTTKQVGPFQVAADNANGFLRQSRVDPHYLQFDSGAGFLPIGHNLPIYHTTGQLAEQAIRKMAVADENYNRWWMSNSGMGIEWEAKLGWYRQASAARLDAMLDLADQLGMYYMLCMDTHQDYREGGWAGNPFNKANGGPCAKVSDWFTNDQAKEYYRKRLRYTIARWGYSPHVLCWEFGNEMEGWADTTEATKIAWVREMSAYLAKLDPYRHLITTSWWSKTGPVDCWKIPDIDIVQTHCYTNNDGNVAEQVRDYCLTQWNDFQKPHLFGEFGIRSHSTTADKDPKGWGLHNAFWAGVTSGACGIPMPWWHENYIDPLNLYFHFTAIHNFVQGLPFGTARWQQVTAEPPIYLNPHQTPEVRDAAITPVSVWGKNPDNEIVLQPDGTIAGGKNVHELLHGAGHKDLQNPPTFVVNYPQPGKFIMTVGRVSNSGHLKIWVDGSLKLDREFPCGEHIGKEWKFQPQWNLWESEYDEDVSVNIPADTHRIKVENSGKDWMRILHYVFTGCTVIDRPNLLVAALKSPDVASVWIQNRESTWYLHQKGEVPAVAASRIILPGFAAGTYDVEWWETWKGAPLRTEQVTARDGKLELHPGPVATDVAAKIRPSR